MNQSLEQNQRKEQFKFITEARGDNDERNDMHH